MLTHACSCEVALGQVALKPGCPANSIEARRKLNHNSCGDFIDPEDPQYYPEVLKDYTGASSIIVDYETSAVAPEPAFASPQPDYAPEPEYGMAADNYFPGLDPYLLSFCQGDYTDPVPYYEGVRFAHSANVDARKWAMDALVLCL